MPEAPVISIEHRPEAVIVRVLATELRKTEMDEICTGVDQALTIAPTLPFIFDLSSVAFLPSLAMGVLVGLNQEFRARNQRIIFAGLQRNVRQSLEMSRVNRVIEIIDSPTAALKNLENHPS